MIEVKRSENESSLSLIRRFTKKVQQSGILKRVHSSQFKTRRESNLDKKEKALKRVKAKKRMDYLWKLGKIEKSRNE
ncbi:MAG: 30S ribosomal protein S21 [Patescibacteria group bacterium]